MQSTTRAKISELKMLISKMPLRVACVMVLPEFGLSWAEVSKAVRKANLPMKSPSVASVLDKYASQSLTLEEISDIVMRLKLKSIATQRRTWHVVKLIDQVHDEPFNFLSTTLPTRIKQILKSSKAVRNRRVEVETVKLGHLVYISVQLLPQARSGNAFYIAVPPDEPLALVSSLTSSLLGACVEALGYREQEDTCLSGKDVISLLHIYNSHQNTLEVAERPVYSTAPCAARSGVDYTGRGARKRLAGELLGPDPPHLDELTVTVEKKFYDRTLLNKRMKLTMQVKSDDVAHTLQSWVVKNAISPDSDLFKIFHTIKSNRIHIDADDI